MSRERWSLCLIVLCIGVLAACTTDPSAAGGPRLVQESTLQPTDVLPVRVSTITPIVIPVSTSESNLPAQAVTIDAEFPDFVLVTPTLPPSKTPTLTATQSPTVTRTLLPSPTLPGVLVPVPQVFFTTPIPAPGSSVANAVSQPCTSAWFFGQSPVPACPLAAPLSSEASYLQFQQGFMIWVGQQKSIYTVYDSANQPRWEVYQDTFADGQPETDPALGSLAPPYTWQPGRGFGLVWRSNAGVRQRIGWAVREWEEPFTIQVQIATSGAIFLTDPHGGIIVLQAGGRDWDRYATS